MDKSEHQIQPKVRCIAVIGTLCWKCNLELIAYDPNAEKHFEIELAFGVLAPVVFDSVDS